jgi:thiosulfate/3-mercaptopyruvate sulfurtransferase
MRNGRDEQVEVVVYDRAGGSVASRLVPAPLVRHESQAVLDGGIGAWGEPLNAEAPGARSGDFASREPDRSKSSTSFDVRKLAGVPCSMPARANAIGAKAVDWAGHIPGALGAPWAKPRSRWAIQVARGLRRHFAGSARWRKCAVVQLGVNDPASCHGAGRTDERPPVRGLVE